jgi:uncharacterized cysteine cluster protein YcgN (CxxCxxCC family)
MKNHCNNCPTGVRGVCCWYSVTDGNHNEAVFPCKYLTKAGRCKDYEHRFEINPGCLSVEEALKIGQFPEQCEYVRRSDIVPKYPYKTKNEGFINEFKKRGLRADTHV